MFENLIAWYDMMISWFGSFYRMFTIRNQARLVYKNDQWLTYDRERTTRDTFKFVDKRNLDQKCMVLLYMTNEKKSFAVLFDICLSSKSTNDCSHSYHCFIIRLLREHVKQKNLEHANDKTYFIEITILLYRVHWQIS